MKDQNLRDCIHRHDLFGEQRYCASCVLAERCLKVRTQMQEKKIPKPTYIKGE
jgi:hypothetical protein